VYYVINTLVIPSTLFHIEPTSGVPIYRQLIDQVLALRSSGRLAAGAFLPSVRQVAEDLAVNPMTVSKAWSLLERDGMVELVRGQGMRVAAPRNTATPAERLAELRPLLDQVVSRAHQLAIPRRDVLDTLAGLLPKDQP
jgi:GntR family transcriptional regulator